MDRIIDSIDGKIGFTELGKTGGVNILAAACSDLEALSLISNPVYKADIRGYGSSTTPNKNQRGYSLQNYIADFDAIFDQTKSKGKKVLLGYSHLGYFTTAYALANPNSIDALVLIEPALFTPQEELLHRVNMAKSSGEKSIERMLSYVEPQIGMRKKDSDKTVKTIMSNVNSDDTLVEEFLVRAENPITDQDLSKLRMPVLLIGGTDSNVNHMVKRAFNAIPYASVYWVEGASHLELQDKKYAGSIARAINSFTEQIE